MWNKYQTIVLKKGLTVALFVVNFLGLWPFKSDRCKRKIKYSSAKAIYSIFSLCLVLTGYTIVAKSAIIYDETLFFGSFTLRLVLFIYAYSIVLSFAFAYINQLWSARDIEFTYKKCVDVVDAMNNSFRDVDFSIYLFEMFVKTIIHDIFYVVVSYNNIVNSSALFMANPFLTLVLMMPIIVGRLRVNIFYGALLAINVYMKKLNSYLIEIVTRAAYVTGQNNEKHERFRMDGYCNFSDEIDKLSALYYKLVDATKSLNSIFSIGIVFWNATTFLILTVQLLYQFIAVIELIHDRKESTMMLYVFGYFSILLSILDLLSTSNASQRIVNAGQRTADILHTAKIRSDVDIRFRRSIEIFSTQILLNKLRITECGMFTLDLKTTTLVISSILSYSVVLLQFELAERRMSM